MVAGALLAATATAAATGVLKVGSVIPGGAPTGENERADETVVATGVTPVAGPWRMTTYTSKKSVSDDGEVMETGDLSCLRLMLTTAVTPLSGSGWCGVPNSDFIVSGLPVATRDGRAEVILFGVAPEAASAVQLTAANGEQIRTATQEQRGDAPGEPWVMAVPPSLTDPEVGWLDQNGTPTGRQRDVSSQLARAAMLRQTLQRDARPTK